MTCSPTYVKDVSKKVEMKRLGGAGQTMGKRIESR
jgi:hypothetical protein